MVDVAMAEKTGVLAEERELQRAWHSEQAEAFGAQLAEGGAKMRDWSYRAPTDDDPETWRGVARWCYLDVIYRWHIDREVLLRRGFGPYVCPKVVHGKEPIAVGFKANECADCYWEHEGYDLALKAARAMGRNFVQQRQAVAS